MSMPAFCSDYMFLVILLSVDTIVLCIMLIVMQLPDGKTQFGNIKIPVASDVNPDHVEEVSGFDDAERSPSLSPEEQDLQNAIELWVEKKMFRYDDMNRDEIAESLGTDRNTLAAFFHHRMNIEFRTWRTKLRIEEAKVLLLSHPELSVSRIGQEVGIPDRSNFQKKFKELVGTTPKAWREIKLNH